MREENTSTDNPQLHDGSERRKGERRKLPDRREMIRFELEKEPRRSGRDRRRSRQDLWERRDF
ncbi:hypothetical protein CKO35_07540 [Ectothiorhodospira shaposhnikovii]|uniref:hypothetical protein n=1 Tax=Ectothiorhodospira shaposhnikovii TaxID=1054 RepID=UPI001905669E|nr:hypothetical protein [Ectothiorhodospira shaposhnikovii]MBK1673161.1 hypothetical protein [Ectothiorhodospira shaposhnikovii]